MRQIFILTFLIFSVSGLYAQPHFSYGGNAYYGGVLRYKSGMSKLELTDLYGFEAYLLKQSNGNNLWEKKYNYPRLGITASYFNYGVPEELGAVGTLAGYLDMHLLRFTKSELRFNLGTGLVYSSVIYHSQNNPENKAIGARFSYELRGNIYYAYHLNEKWDLNFNLAFRHYSNGRMNMPNNGMNFPALGVGVAYSPKAVQFIDPVEEEVDKKMRITIFGATAWREELNDDVKQKAYTLSLAVHKRFSFYNALLIGLDGFHYAPESIHRQMSLNNTNIELDEIDSRQVAVTIGHELYFGKVSLVTQGGLYLHDPHKAWSSWYQRYALKYHPLDKMFVQVGLKAHSRTANMVEWGLGVHL